MGRIFVKYYAASAAIDGTYGPYLPVPFNPRTCYKSKILDVL
ncbi:hypothetical protein C900_04095 [Fulvivirga imtechensis AK7]|uniref:Uncharacterized protein n=1 Tax=Fulvivirga imtechensis AK7 TaxID=1237149 RepID=L8JPG1_9BACT|nr:hypothetical protein C900_04095 [Fulvivirga imtechensis AK7]